jgi:hypothetical protein
MSLHVCPGVVDRGNWYVVEVDELGERRWLLGPYTTKEDAEGWRRATIRERAAERARQRLDALAHSHALRRIT